MYMLIVKDCPLSNGVITLMQSTKLQAEEDSEMTRDLVMKESSTNDAQDACNADIPESSRISNPTATSKIPPANQMELLTVESENPTVSSPVLTVCLDISPETSSGSRLISKGVISQEETPSLDNALTLSNRFEDTIGVKADLRNMESSIPASPTPTFKIHKDHPRSQIIGPVDTPVQTRHKKNPRRSILVDCPKGIRPIGTKWVLKNKKDKRGIVIRNKARLVTQGHIQEEGIDYEEVFAPIARIEAIRLFLAYALFMGFIGKDRPGKDVELYLYRSLIGSLMYLTASRPDIMFAVYACARHQVTPKECHLHAVKRIFRYLKGHPKLGLWYPKESPFDLVAYLDSDCGSAIQDRKLTTGGCLFLGRRLISWQCKKQTIMATSTTEAEYVAAASGCEQVLWIQNQMLDYGEDPVLSCGLLKDKKNHKKSSKVNEVLHPKPSPNTKYFVRRLPKEVAKEKGLVKPKAARVESNVGKRKRLVKDKEIEDERDSDVEGSDGESDSDKEHKVSEEADVSNESEEEGKGVKTKVFKGKEKVVVSKFKKQNEEVKDECDFDVEAKKRMHVSDSSSEEDKVSKLKKVSKKKKFVMRAFSASSYEFKLEKGIIRVTPKKVHEILRVLLGGTSIFDLPKIPLDGPFVKEWFKQFDPKPLKKIHAYDIAKKLVLTKTVDFMFKVNFLMLFANVMGTADTMKLMYLDSTKFDKFLVIHQRLAIRNWTTTAMNQRHELEIEEQVIGKLDLHGEWTASELDQTEGFYDVGKNVSQTRTSSMPPTDKKLMYLDSTKFDKFLVIRQRPVIRNWTTTAMNQRHELEIEEQVIGKLDLHGEWTASELDQTEGGKNDNPGFDHVGKKKESTAKDVGKKDGVNAEKDVVNVVQEGEADVNEEPKDMLKEETLTQWF
nr:uncharacterized mitochondrial protein AtMg00810-like [Tanacetum cinerariifolium]